jgi:hypothetical protein
LISTARPFSTVTSVAQVSGQSCGHAPRTMLRVAGDARDGDSGESTDSCDDMGGCRAA